MCPYVLIQVPCGGHHCWKCALPCSSRWIKLNMQRLSKEEWFHHSCNKFFDFLMERVSTKTKSVLANEKNEPSCWWTSFEVCLPWNLISETKNFFVDPEKFICSAEFCSSPSSPSINIYKFWSNYSLTEGKGKQCRWRVFLKMGHSRLLFLYFRLFYLNFPLGR